MTRVFADEAGQRGVSGLVCIKFFPARPRRPDVVDVDLVGLQFGFQESIPVENSRLVAVHETCAGLDVQSRTVFLDRLQLAGSVDCDVPASGLLTDLFMILLQAIDTQSD